MKILPWNKLPSPIWKLHFLTPKIRAEITENVYWAIKMSKNNEVTHWFQKKTEIFSIYHVHIITNGTKYLSLSKLQLPIKMYFYWLKISFLNPIIWYRPDRLEQTDLNKKNKFITLPIADSINLSSDKWNFVYRQSFIIKIQYCNIIGTKFTFTSL